MAFRPIYHDRKDTQFTPYELAIIKQTVLTVRSSKVSYNKIGKAFRLSSRTVWRWTQKISFLIRKSIQVNIKTIAQSLYQHIHAWRKKWISKIDISNILNGVEIH